VLAQAGFRGGIDGLEFRRAMAHFPHGHAGAAPVEQFFANALEHGERERGGAGVEIEDTFCSGSSHEGRHDSFLQKGEPPFLLSAGR